MKKIIYIAAVSALAFTACSKSVVSEKAHEAVSFSTYAGRSVTKAADSYLPKDATVFADGAKIGVYAYLNSLSAIPNFLKDEAVTLDAGGATPSASYTNKVYWPKDETNKLTFFAYYPYNCAGLVRTGVGANYGTMTYTVPGTIADQEDFMLADAVKNAVYSNSAIQSGTAGAVKFDFHHMLTRVLFRFKTDNAAYGTTDSNTKITVTSAKLKGIETVATLALAETAAASTWGVPATAVEFSVPVPSSNLLAASAAPADTRENVFLLLPQALDDSAVLELEYTVKTGENAAVTNKAVVKLNEVTAGNPATAVTKWEKNNNIVYTISIGLKIITFAAEFQSWDNAQNADHLIN